MSEPPRRLTDAQRLDWLRLIRSDQIGPRTFWALMDHYGSASRALAVVPELVRRGGALRSVKLATKAAAEREMAALTRMGAWLIAHGEADYPALLARIDAAPPLIAVRGERAALQRPLVAIVGSRNASAAGMTFTERLAHGLAEAGFVIVSGLARGIDSRAHRAALTSGTVAVLPGGLDRVYPAENAPLAESIVKSGVVLTEMPLGWEARAKDFPRRNRIVAGLAHGTVVVEAARRSGSLITARLANEQGREVFAVPGSPLDPRAEGTNDLLKQGATICTSAQDVIDALAPRLAGLAAPEKPSGMRAPKAEAQAPWEPAPPATASDRIAAALARDAEWAEDEAIWNDASDGLHEKLEMHQRVMTLLGPSPIGIDDLARSLAAPVRDVQQAILELELAGRIVRHGGNLVSLQVPAS